MNGIKQKPIEGVSMAYTFDKANADMPSTRKTQYFEMIANRGIYHDGWYACTTPPHGAVDIERWAPARAVNDYKWELYNLAEDYSQANDLASKMPDKLKELQGVFEAEARKYKVFPLDNSILPRLVTPRPSATPGRPNLRTRVRPPASRSPMRPASLTRTTPSPPRSRPKGGAEGMIVTMGGRFGGYGFSCSRASLSLSTTCWISSGSAGKADRWQGRRRLVWSGARAGKHTLVFDFKYDGPGPAKGGTGVLTVDGKELARKSISTPFQS